MTRDRKTPSTTAAGHKVLRLPAVKALVGLGSDSIYRLARDGRFPRPIKLSERASGWLEYEVLAFLQRRIAERDANAASKSAAA